MIRGLARGCSNLVGCLLMLVLVAAMLFFAAPTLARYVPGDIALVQSPIAKFEAKMKADHIGPAVSPAAGTSRPSAADCRWGEAALATDSSLDLQGAVNYPQWAAYYRQTSGWWLAAGRQLQALCGAGSTGPEPTAAGCFTTIGHFETA